MSRGEAMRANPAGASDKRLALLKDAQGKIMDEQIFAWDVKPRS
jgi:hypothetical protein